MNQLFIFGLIGLGIIAFIKRCDWFKICGSTPAPAPAAVAPIPAKEINKVATTDAGAKAMANKYGVVTTAPTTAPKKLYQATPDELKKAGVLTGFTKISI